MTDIKFKITRKPPPPPLDPFECVVCQETIERDSWRPELERPPVCFRCSLRVPSRPQLAGAPAEARGDFYRAHAVLCAIKQEIERARRTH